jgi:hypothetical protein
MRVNYEDNPAPYRASTTTTTTTKLLNNCDVIVETLDEVPDFDFFLAMVLLKSIQ